MDLLDAVIRNRMGTSDAVRRQAVDGASPTIVPRSGVFYQCGTLDSLTVSNPPETGIWAVAFTSGDSPATTTIPVSVKGLEAFAAKADTRYEINVLDGYAVVGCWE